MSRWMLLWGLLLVCWACVASAWAQAGVRSYVVRRLYEQGQKQRFNAVYSLRGDTRSSTFEQSMPIAVDAQLRFDTEVLQVLENGQARMRVATRYVKQSVDYFAETELPPPYTETVKVTPSGFPSEDDAERVVQRVKRGEKKDDEKREEPSFPGLDFLLPPSYFLQLIGLNVVPGPFAPLPPGSVREGDEWQVRYPTPFIDTRGGKLSLEQATLYTYPATVRVVGATEIKGASRAACQANHRRRNRHPLGRPAHRNLAPARPQHPARQDPRRHQGRDRLLLRALGRLAGAGVGLREAQAPRRVRPADHPRVGAYRGVGGVGGAGDLPPDAGRGDDSRRAAQTAHATRPTPAQSQAVSAVQ